MADRDEWFAIHASGEVEKSLAKQGAEPTASGGFRVDPDAAPAMRAGFEEAIKKMTEAQTAMRQMRVMADSGVNPVVDKVVKALAGVGYGADGSVIGAAESALTVYQSVIDQLDRAMADYRQTEESSEQNMGRHS